MVDKPTDLVQGTLDMLILKTMALEPIDGYGVAVRIEQLSGGAFRVNTGSLAVAAIAGEGCALAFLSRHLDRRNLCA